MRVIQISDTHLSAEKPHFLDNWRPLADWIKAQRPDLVIHTGDVTVDGAGNEADLAYAARLLDELGVRWRAVPGNHDVGDAGHARQPVDARRLAACIGISARTAGSKISAPTGPVGDWSGSTRCSSGMARLRKPCKWRGLTK
jgi:predicted phosphodiesterase